MLEGQVILVAGGRRGLGGVLSAALAARGATVVAMGRSGEAPHLDVRSERSVQEAFAWMDRTHGRLDVLLNCAGAGVFKPLESLALSEWTEVLETNLTGAFLCAREAFGRMRRQGGGRIVNVGSVAGQRGLPLMGAYGASKFGLRGLTQVLNEEGREVGVQACLLSLGAVRIGLGNAVPGLRADHLLAPEDVAEAVVKLLELPLSIRMDEVTLVPTRGVI